MALRPDPGAVGHRDRGGRHAAGHGGLHGHPDAAAADAAVRLRRRRRSDLLLLAEEPPRAGACRTRSSTASTISRSPGDTGLRQAAGRHVAQGRAPARADPGQRRSSRGGAPVDAVVESTPGAARTPTVVTVDLDQTGDFSTYTFALVAAPGIDDPPDGIRSGSCRASSFSFKAGCPTPADCLPEQLLPARPRGRRRTSTTWPRTTTASGR